MLILDAERRVELAAVNRAVNAQGYVTDWAKYGVADHWTAADGPEDCDGLAMQKRKRLLAAGWPWPALRLATCWVETGEYHLVLIVEGRDAGGEPLQLVLDNRHTTPKRVDALRGYRWHVWQVAGAKRWAAIAQT